MTKSVELLDYNQYTFRGIERLILFLKIGTIVCLLAYFFYQSLWAVLGLWPLAFVIKRREEQRKVGKRRQELNKEFMECMLSVNVSLQAGYSVENAFLESKKDMETFFGVHSCIFLELEGIRRGLVVNIPLEELLFQLGERSGIEDIRQFAQIFAIAKKRGGDLVHIITNTVERIRQRVETQEEIQVVMAGKSMEQTIMRVMPFGILVYIGLSYPGYFDPLYHNLKGIFLMSVALVLYGFAFWLGDYIVTQIEKEMTASSVLKQEKPIKSYETGVFAKVGLLVDRLGALRMCGNTLRQDLEFLYPEQDKLVTLRLYVKQKMVLLSEIFVASLGFFGLLCFRSKKNISVGKGTFLVLIGAGLFTGLLYFLMDKDLSDRATKKRELRRMQYPDIVHKLVLYMGAGLSVRGCFEILSHEYDCILFACRDFQAGLLEPVVFERFGRRLGIGEYIRLGMLLGQNAKRGNSLLLERLEEEALNISKSKTKEAKILGEKAQTKLLVPMVLLLLVVMLFIMVPAFLEM